MHFSFPFCSRSCGSSRGSLSPSPCSRSLRSYHARGGCPPPWCRFPKGAQNCSSEGSCFATFEALLDSPRGHACRAKLNLSVAAFRAGAWATSAFSFCSFYVSHSHTQSCFFHLIIHSKTARDHGLIFAQPKNYQTARSFACHSRTSWKAQHLNAEPLVKRGSLRDLDMAIPVCPTTPRPLSSAEIRSASCLNWPAPRKLPRNEVESVA